MIYFSTEKCVSRVHGPVDHYSGRSMVDSRPGQSGALTGVWRATATEGGSSPREHLEKEGAEGQWAKGGSTGRSEANDEEQWRRAAQGGARPTMRSSGGGG
jgi:hypothetical protein